MPENVEPGPFSEFAAPKKTAVEQLRERQEQRRRRRRLVIRALCGAVASTVLATSIGLTIHQGIRVFPVVLIAALVGAVVGLLGGALFGCICFAIMNLMQTRRGSGFEANVARSDPMAVLTFLAVACGVVGAGIGAGEGGLAGTAWFLDSAPDSADHMAAMIGAFAGLVLAGIGWLVWMRTRKVGAGTENAA